MDPTLSLNGDPNIGVYARVFEDLAVVPVEAPKEFRDKIAEALDVEVIETFIQGSSVIGLLLTGNSRGFVVSGLIQDSELEILQEYGDCLLAGEWEVVYGEKMRLPRMMYTNEYDYRRGYCWNG